MRQQWLPVWRRTGIVVVSVVCRISGRVASGGGCFESNSIYDNAEANVKVLDGDRLTFLKNAIKQCKGHGVVVWGGCPDFVTNEIHENQEMGLQVCACALRGRCIRMADGSFL